jgi:ribonuclease HI
LAHGKVILSVDGCSLGNPGPAGIGVVVHDADGLCLAAFGEFIGETTNNVAEYEALLRGLREVKRLGLDTVEVHTDSELLARQIDGSYRVKAPHLRPLRARALAELGQFRSAAVRSVRREANRRADELARRAAKNRKAIDGLQDV